MYFKFSTFLFFLCRGENNADSDFGEFELASEPLGLETWSIAHFNDNKPSIIIFLK